MKSLGVKIWGAKDEFDTIADAKKAANAAGKSGDQLYNLTMAVNGKGTHAWQTHERVYQLIRGATDGPDLSRRLKEIGNIFADKGTLLDPRTMQPWK